MSEATDNNANSDNFSFVEAEHETLSFWKEHQVFAKSLEQTRDCQPYIFYDGPPFATGLPHYGHLLAGTIKDVIPRYQTMRGHYVARRFGWDCHGLPIEALAQETELEILGIQARHARAAGREELAAEIERAIDIVRNGQRFLVACHRRPDADSLGSALGLIKTLQVLGKEDRGHAPAADLPLDAVAVREALAGPFLPPEVPPGRTERPR